MKAATMSSAKVDASPVIGAATVKRRLVTVVPLFGLVTAAVLAVAPTLGSTSISLVWRKTGYPALAPTTSIVASSAGRSASGHQMLRSGFVVASSSMIRSGSTWGGVPASVASIGSTSVSTTTGSSTSRPL